MGVQLLHVLDATAAGKKLGESRARTVWVRYPEPSRKKILQPSTLQPPNEDCFVCGARTARVAVKSMSEWKIAAFVKSCVQGSLGAHRAAVYYNHSCIFDPEYPEASEEAEEEGLHPEWTLQEWGLSSGALLQVEDEGQGFSCNLLIREDPELTEESGFTIEAGAAPEPAAEGVKRPAEDTVAEPPAKKLEVAAAKVDTV